jgi:hypothetical protein
MGESIRRQRVLESDGLVFIPPGSPHLFDELYRSPLRVDEARNQFAHTQATEWQKSAFAL